VFAANSITAKTKVLKKWKIAAGAKNQFAEGANVIAKRKQVIIEIGRPSKLKGENYEIILFGYSITCFLFFSVFIQ
jgi:hypothetical protein